jgi:hypothetical protein
LSCYGFNQACQTWALAAEADIKVRIPSIFFACFLVCSEFAAAQAISQGVLLNQQATQSAGGGTTQSVQAVRQSGTRVVLTGAQDVTSSTPPRSPSFDDPTRSRQPYLSEYPGYVAPGTELVIANPNPAATIFYTTDGWTPTQNSLRYVGPITIQNDMRLQVFAVEPGMLPSPIVDATFIVKPQPRAVSKSITLDEGVLRRGMALRMVTCFDARSDSAQPGDPVLLKLDENVMVGDKVVVPRGALGKGAITSVAHAGIGGKPGVITFKVESLEVHGTTIPLTANLTLSAPDLAAQAVKLSDPAAVRISGTLPRGDEALIEPGMPLTANVAADTPLH